MRLTGAVVLPCVTEMLPRGAGYRVRILPPWTGTSGQGETNEAADARAMNALIEDLVAGMPAQYHWLHKRFKTRPPGEPSPY